jgi:type I restriction enzyme S subunit
MEIQEVTLGEISTITMGTSPKGETYNYEGIGIPLLNGPTEFGLIHPKCTLFTTDSKKDCKKGDLIFCVRGSTTGRMNWADMPYSLGRGVCSIRGTTPMDTKYIKYYLDYKLDALLKLSGGATFPNLTGNDFATFNILYQKNRHKIAAILSSYDDLIENNTRRIKILEEMAQALYREWFVKFRFPGHEKVKMVESELGMVPEGWEVIKLFDVARLHRGKSYRSLDLVEEGGLPFLNLKCIERGGGFRYDGIKRYQGKFKETQTAKSGDILMAITDMTQERRLVAHTARVPVLDGNISVISMDLIKIEPMPEMHEEYIYGMLRFSEFADKVKQYANGANVLHLSPDRVADFKFALPPSNLRSQYSAFCSNLYQQCDNLNIKNPNLRRTRDLLLPKLISGELNVQNFDINTINNKT